MQPVRSGRLPEDKLRTRKTVSCYRYLWKRYAPKIAVIRRAL